MKREPRPEASVVVPARDAAKTLPRLLDALAGAAGGGVDLEVIVVDNASRDRTAQVAEARGARVVAEPVPGRARARNAGIAAASADRVLFCDADCEPLPGWAAALSGALSSTPLAAGPVELRTGEPPNACERFDLLWRFRQRESVEGSGWAASANLAATREALEAIGGFDPAYRQIGEDVDLCLRARDAGYVLGYAQGAVVAHEAESRLGPVLRRAFRHGWSSAQHHHRIGGGVGRRYWRHPMPALRGRWALERFGVDPGSLQADERRRMTALARLEYAARVAGSAWAEVRRAR